MKRSFFILIISISIFCTSCNNLFFMDNETIDVQKKQSIKPFTHLKEPIVITMGVYENSYFLGIENWGTQVNQVGSIFIVIDIETNSVYDWVFTPIPLLHWRAIEVGKNPTKYFSDSPSTGQIAWIEPNDTKVHSVNVDYNTYMFNYSTPGKYTMLTEYGYDREIKEPTYSVKIFDSVNEKLSDKVHVFPEGNYISPPKADTLGNYWFVYYLDDEAKIAKIITAEDRSESYDIKDYGGKDYYFNYADEKYVIINESNNTEPSRIYVLDSNTCEELYRFEAPKINNERSLFIKNVVANNGKYYAIYRESFSTTYFLEIDLEKESIKKLDYETEFDSTESMYMRGSRLYMMCSRCVEDVKYMYYDFATGEEGPVQRITYEDVIKIK